MCDHDEALYKYTFTFTCTLPARLHQFLICSVSVSVRTDRQTDGQTHRQSVVTRNNTFSAQHNSSAGDNTRCINLESR